MHTTRDSILVSAFSPLKADSTGPAMILSELIVFPDGSQVLFELPSHDALSIVSFFVLLLASSVRQIAPLHWSVVRHNGKEMVRR